MSQQPPADETPEETLARLQRSSRYSASVPPAPGAPRHSPPLRMTRFREGYHVGEVDDFLDRVHTCTPEEVSAARFTTVRLSSGYDEDLVDALLDDVAEWLRQGADVRRRLAIWSPP